MAKGKGKAAFKGKRTASQSNDSDPMAFKRASRVNKITSARDAGFEGQDAFGLGDDEIALDGHANGANGEYFACEPAPRAAAILHPSTMIVAWTTLKKLLEVLRDYVLTEVCFE